MSHSKSYDVAYRLCHILRNYMKKFSRNDNITIYPSAWYEGLFNITVRNKEQSDKKEHDIDLKTMFDIIDGYLEDGWEMKEVNHKKVVEDGIEYDKIHLPIELGFTRNE